MRIRSKIRLHLSRGVIRGGLSRVILSAIFYLSTDMDNYRKHILATSTPELDTKGIATREILVKISIPEKSINSVLRFEPNLTVIEAIAKIVRRYPVDDLTQYGLFKDNLLLDERTTLTELELSNYVSITSPLVSQLASFNFTLHLFSCSHAVFFFSHDRQLILL